MKDQEIDEQKVAATKMSKGPKGGDGEGDKGNGNGGSGTPTPP